MSEKKHIDRLFQEKFKDFEAKPSDSVWAGIQSKIKQPEEKTKSGAPIWLRYAGIAAALLLLITVGNVVFNSQDTQRNTNDTIVDTNTKNNTKTAPSKNDNNNNDDALNGTVTTSEDENNSFKNKSEASTNEPLVNVKNDLANDSETNNSAQPLHNNNAPYLNTQNSENQKASNTSKNTVNRYASTKTNSTAIGINNKADSNSQNQASSPIKNNTADNSTIASNTTNKKESNGNTQQNNLNKNTATPNTTVATTDNEKEEEKMMEPDSANSSNTIEEALAKIEDFDEKEEEENVNRWSVSANAAPVYYNTLGKGSHIHDQFINNPKNGEINTSYGVNVGYALNDKLKLRSGINKLNLSYDTANVIIYESVANTPSSSPLRNINFVPTNQGENIAVLSANNLSVQQISGVVNDNLNAALSQRLSYMEVPLELEYAVSNKRFGVNVIGGFSTFILNDNEVVTEVENRKTKIGEANNINNVSFSANAGIGIDYKFSKALKFNLEPTFKYQINAYSETSGDFKPYIIGVYTGFSYKF
ncbi:outer membrane beta-barrel protein [Lacinutrix chionoecetis]